MTAARPRRKPREWWVNVYQDVWVPHTCPENAEAGAAKLARKEVVHLREVPARTRKKGKVKRA